MTDLDENFPDPSDTVEAARARGVFLVPRCEDCRRTFWHPRRHCPTCLSTRIRCVEPELPARVAAWTRNHRPRAGGEPVALGYVELGDGLLVLARLELPDGVDPAGLTVVPEVGEGGNGETTVVFTARAVGDDGAR